MTDEKRDKLELVHIIQTGRDKLEEFDLKAHELLDSVSKKANVTFSNMERKNDAGICKINKIVKDVTDKMDKKVDKAWGYVFKFLTLIAIIVVFAMTIIGRNSLAINKMINEEKAFEVFMTKNGSKIAFEWTEMRLDSLSKGIIIIKDTTNYNWAVKSVFDENHRGTE